MDKLHKSIRRKIYLAVFVFAFAFIVVFCGYVAVIESINEEHYGIIESEVSLRPFPFPYRAGLAISNDIDKTETLDEFIEIHKFINTKEKTSMGNGVGLDIGNSFLFWEPPSGSISYFGSKDPRIAAVFRKYMREGQIDILHSYGQKPDFERSDAVVALHELQNNGIKLDVWIDHSHSHSNLGDDVTFGLGDHSLAKEYHADLTLAYGIKFVWLGRVTMIAGQSVPITWKTYLSIFDIDHPLYSTVNVAKEWGKNVVALLGSRKYAMHRDNELVRVTTLDNGMKIYEFTRFDYSWKGVGEGASAKGLAYSLARRTLERLEEDGGYMVVYTHLGKNSDCKQYLCMETQDTLKNLEKEHDFGNIFVTTTSGLLNYYVRHKYLKWSFKAHDGFTKIVIHSVNDPVSGSYVPSVFQLAGFTFYVPDANKTTISINDVPVNSIMKNKQDYRGRESVTIFPAESSRAMRRL